MKIKALMSYLEGIAPPVFQESYDNSGLITGNPAEEIKGVLICLDSTEEVIEEAIGKTCNLVIAHHPIIFKGLKQLSGSNYVERVVIKAIKNDIAIYAIHTNLDNVYRQGVNGKIAQKLGLINTRILARKTVPSASIISFENSHTQIGSGLIGELAEPMEEAAFLQFLKKVMKVNCIRYTRLLGEKVKTVALCGGAGSFLLKNAILQQADVFVSADFKYHEFFDADGRILIADIGHFESEQFTIQLLFEIISRKFSNFAAHCTEVDTNPVKYHI